MKVDLTGYDIINARLTGGSHDQVQVQLCRGWNVEAFAFWFQSMEFYSTLDMYELER